jgi:hypothetical protein
MNAIADAPHLIRRDKECPDRMDLLVVNINRCDLEHARKICETT